MQSKFWVVLNSVGLIFILMGCSSKYSIPYSSSKGNVVQRVFPGNQNEIWKSTLQALNNFVIKEKNREGGVIKTAWMDNTSELNFSDAFDRGDTVHGARFKMIINVFSGSMNNQESTQVTVRKRQQVERELMQGWRNYDRVDQVLEKTILYRIGRVLIINKRLEDLQIQKEKEAEKKAKDLEDSQSEMDDLES